MRERNREPSPRLQGPTFFPVKKVMFPRGQPSFRLLNDKIKVFFPCNLNWCMSVSITNSFTYKEESFFMRKMNRYE